MRAGGFCGNRILNVAIRFQNIAVDIKIADAILSELLLPYWKFPDSEVRFEIKKCVKSDQGGVCVGAKRS